MGTRTTRTIGAVGVSVGHPDGFRGRQGIPYGVGGGVRNQDGPNRGMLMGGPARSFSSSPTSSNVSLPLPMPENALRRSGQSSAPTTPSIILKESPRLQPVVLPRHTRQTIQSTYIDNDDDLDRLAMIDERGRGRGSDLGRVSVATSALTDDRDPFSYAEYESRYSVNSQTEERLHSVEHLRHPQAQAQAPGSRNWDPSLGHIQTPTPQSYSHHQNSEQAHERVIRNAQLAAARVITRTPSPDGRSRYSSRAPSPNPTLAGSSSPGPQYANVNVTPSVMIGPPTPTRVPSPISGQSNGNEPDYTEEPSKYTSAYGGIIETKLTPSYYPPHQHLQQQHNSPISPSTSTRTSNSHLSGGSASSRPPSLTFTNRSNSLETSATSPSSESPYDPNEARVKGPSSSSARTVGGGAAAGTISGSASSEAGNRSRSYSQSSSRVNFSRPFSNYSQGSETTNTNGNGAGAGRRFADAPPIPPMPLPMPSTSRATSETSRSELVRSPSPVLRNPQQQSASGAAATTTTITNSPHRSDSNNSSRSRSNTGSGAPAVRPKITLHTQGNAGLNPREIRQDLSPSASSVASYHSYHSSNSQARSVVIGVDEYEPKLPFGLVGPYGGSSYQRDYFGQVQGQGQGVQAPNEGVVGGDARSGREVRNVAGGFGGVSADDGGPGWAGGRGLEGHGDRGMERRPSIPNTQDNPTITFSAPALSTSRQTIPEETVPSHSTREEHPSPPLAPSDIEPISRVASPPAQHPFVYPNRTVDEQIAEQIRNRGPSTKPTGIADRKAWRDSRPEHMRKASNNSSYSDTFSFYQLPPEGQEDPIQRTGFSPTPHHPANLSRSNSTSPTMTKAMALFPPNVRPGPSSGDSKNDPMALLGLGIKHHETGDLPRATYFFEKSAKGGCGAGMLMYGLSLRHGWGCQPNPAMGFKYLQKAAELVVEDLDRTVAAGHVNLEKETKAAKNELVLAVYELGMCFSQGWGIKRDKKMALSYFELAANLGDPDAQQEVGFCYVNGKGCKKDRKKAAKYYRMAAAQGAETFGQQWIFKDKYMD